MRNFSDRIMTTEELIEKYNEDYLQFVEDTKGEDILQVVLRGHLYIERELTNLLHESLKNPEEILNSRTLYGIKLNMACAIGVLPVEDKKPYLLFGKIRNGYAHTWRFELKEKDLEDLVKSFEGNLRERYEYTLTHNEMSLDLISRLRNLIAVMWTNLRVWTYEYTYEETMREMAMYEYELMKREEEIEKKIKEAKEREALLTKQLEETEQEKVFLEKAIDKGEKEIDLLMKEIEEVVGEEVFSLMKKLEEAGEEEMVSLMKEIEEVGGKEIASIIKKMEEVKRK